VGLVSLDVGRPTREYYAGFGVDRLTRFPYFLRERFLVKAWINLLSCLAHRTRFQTSSILCVASDSLLLGYPVSRLFHRPCYVRFIGSDIYLLYLPARNSKERLAALLARTGLWFAKHAEGVVVMNNWMRDVLMAKGVPPSRIHVIPNGSDFVPYESEGNSADQFRLTFVGRFSSGMWGEKRIAVLIQAFSIFLGRHPNSRLTLAGDGDDRKRLEQLAKELSVQDRVRFTGFLGVEEVRRELGETDCFVFPSVMEGMSNSLLEAVLSGVPILAADIPQNRELLMRVPGSLMVDPRVPDSLTKGLEEMYDSIIERKRLALAAAEELRPEYSVQTMATRYEELMFGGGTPIARVK
jgi:glycosyltransferase involved in cell wall biosynthesis